MQQNYNDYYYFLYSDSNNTLGPGDKQIYPNLTITSSNIISRGRASTSQLPSKDPCPEYARVLRVLGVKMTIGRAGSASQRYGHTGSHAYRSPFKFFPGSRDTSMHHLVLSRMS
jgi:hypothetical protein